MMRFAAFAVSILLAFGAFTPAQAALSRAGPYVGAKHIIIKKSLEEDMVRAGVPHQCRMEAHEVLTQFVTYSYDTAPENNPTLDILCAFNATSAGGAKGMIGKAIGQRGTVGGVRYIHFVSDTKNIERFILPPAAEKRSDVFSHLLHFATTGNVSGTNLACAASGQCGNASLFATPIAGAAITSGYGARGQIAGVNNSHDHRAIDLGAACGTPIHAAASGVVVTSQNQSYTTNGRRGGAGNYIAIDHGNGIVTRYFHQQGLELAVGAVVTQGQTIGHVGQTGGASGCHLHYETIVNGVKVNPMSVTGHMTSAPLTAAQVASLQQAMPQTQAALAQIPTMDNFDEGGAPGVFHEGGRPTTGASVYGGNT